MSRSVQQWLRVDPVFARMNADVIKARAAWPAAHVVAHRDEITGAVSFHLHVRRYDRHRLFGLLGEVPLQEMRNGSVVSFHFQGGREHMDRLLQGLLP